jgi:6-phosphofructokinase 1
VKRLAVLTSGGDAPGMNAAVRAVVRTGIARGLEVFFVSEGYRGMVEGGDNIVPADWDTAGGIMHRGGTVIGSARCPDFLEREGRTRAARNLLEHDIDGLVVIGGDGSLTGASIFRTEWPDLIADLVASGEVDPSRAEAHPGLALVGLVASIDNDMFGTDMTIGADSALHRITAAIDDILSTAASHQRSFVVEVMGRNCGYLALMSALATGSNWVFIPERPPAAEDWEEEMCGALARGRKHGRRQNVVVVAEGARDRKGKPITAAYVKEVLEGRLGEDTRVTILGHVQRGGAPSAFDRNLATVLGSTAVELLSADPNSEPQVVGIRENQVISSPLMECVEKTRAVAERIAAHDYEAAMDMRGGSFKESFRLQKTLTRARPHKPVAGRRQHRFAILHAGGPAPGMNPAVRVAARVGIDRGHVMLAIANGFSGLRRGRIEQLDWMGVSTWASRGGALLGTSRFVPGDGDFSAIAEQLREHQVDGMLMIGGWAGYEAAFELHARRREFAEFNIPIVCMPASINNDLPASDFSIGADTALNNIVTDVDKIKQSAVATRRCFVVEVMGHDCGYLPLLSGLATGAETEYLPEEGITLAALQRDVVSLNDGFDAGKRLGLVIRGERADPVYTTSFIEALFEKEGGDRFDVRPAILGHIQQGGDPSPFDRIQANRLAAECLGYLMDQAGRRAPESAMIGLERGKIRFTALDSFPLLVESEAQRPIEQPWLGLRPLAHLMASRPAAIQ